MINPRPGFAERASPLPLKEKPESSRYAALGKLSGRQVKARNLFGNEQVANITATASDPMKSPPAKYNGMIDAFGGNAKRKPHEAFINEPFLLSEVGTKSQKAAANVMAVANATFCPPSSPVFSDSSEDLEVEPSPLCSAAKKTLSNNVMSPGALELRICPSLDQLLKMSDDEVYEHLRAASPKEMFAIFQLIRASTTWELGAIYDSPSKWLNSWDLDKIFVDIVTWISENSELRTKSPRSSLLKKKNQQALDCRITIVGIK